jgi:hypothetical protein
VRVKKEIYGYRKKRSSDSQVIDMPDVFMPPLEYLLRPHNIPSRSFNLPPVNCGSDASAIVRSRYETFGMWIGIPAVVREEVVGAGWAVERGGLHAVEHLLITLCPLLVHTEPNDLKCQCTRRKGDGCAEYIMLFEANKGGIGLAGRIADTIEQLLAAALRRIVGCHCLMGCSSCIHLQNCGDYNEGLDKAAAIYILCRLLGRPCNALPSQTAEEPAATAAWTPGVYFGDDGEDPELTEEWDDEDETSSLLAPDSAGRCVICLSRFETPVTTACGHMFCLGCLKQHISSSNTAATARSGPAASAASRGNAYAPGARCPICRMPCAMSELRPAEFDGAEKEPGTCEANSEPELGQGAGGQEPARKVAETASAGGFMADGDVENEWAAAEAAWAAAEAEADAS